MTDYLQHLDHFTGLSKYAYDTEHHDSSLWSQIQSCHLLEKRLKGGQIQE